MMLKNQKLIGVALFVTTLSACTGEQPKSTQENADATTSAEVQATKQTNVESGKQAATGDMTSQVLPMAVPLETRALPSKGQLAFNNTTLVAQTLPVVKGTSLFDKSVNQSAVATGNIVVVAKPDTSALNWQKEYEVTELAPNTYSLTPKDGSDLVLSYKQLKKDNNITAIELELDYTPISKKETM